MDDAGGVRRVAMAASDGAGGRQFACMNGGRPWVHDGRPVEDGPEHMQKMVEFVWRRVVSISLDNPSNPSTGKPSTVNPSAGNTPTVNPSAGNTPTVKRSNVGKCYGSRSTAVACEDIRSALAGERDGYKIARSLDRAGWAASAELVWCCSLNNVERHRCLSEAVCDWVMKTGARFPANEGEDVTFRGESGLMIRANVLGSFPFLASALVQDTHGVQTTIIAEQVEATHKKRFNVVLPMKKASPDDGPRYA